MATKQQPDTTSRLREHVDQRLESLRSSRYSYWTHWRECADYILPRRYKWLVVQNQAQRGSPINQRIIDSTATLAVRTLAAGMMTGITSPSRRWFKLTLDDDDLSDYLPVATWLDIVEKRMMRVFAESNFYTACSVLYEDLAVFGTAPLLIYEDRENIISCQNPCAGEYFVENSAQMKIGHFYREFVLTVSQLVDQFGLDGASPTVKGLFDKGGAGLATEIKVAHAIEPNDARTGPKVGDFAFREVYWEYGSARSEVLSLRGFHEFPAMVPRWYLVGNESYGRSPGMDALGDIKQLQVEQKRKAQAIDKMVNPPMLADVSLKNEPASVLPGGMTFVAMKTGNEGFRPVYQVQPELQYMIADIKEVQQRIKDTFFTDLFLMISQLDTVRSATEIAARREEKMLMLSPVLERFQTEFLDPVIDRTFNIMMRASLPYWRGQTMRGLLPKPPPELLRSPMRVEYVSMLADAQRAVATTGMERTVSMAGNLMAARPDIFDNIDTDQYIRDYGRDVGFPPKIMVPPEKVAQIRQQRAQQQAQDKMVQQALTASQAGKNLSDTDVGGGLNAVQAMTGLQPAGNA